MELLKPLERWKDCLYRPENEIERRSRLDCRSKNAEKSALYKGAESSDGQDGDWSRKYGKLNDRKENNF